MEFGENLVRPFEKLVNSLRPGWERSGMTICVLDPCSPARYVLFCL